MVSLDVTTSDRFTPPGVHHQVDGTHEFRLSHDCTVPRLLLTLVDQSTNQSTNLLAINQSMVTQHANQSITIARLKID